MRLVAMDPGVKYFAWALFHDGKLVRCGLHEHAQKQPHPNIAVDLVVVEKPRKVWRGKVETYLDLCFAAGVFARGFSPNVEDVDPNRWKGNVDKTTHHEWIMADLSPAERVLIPTKKKESIHVLDSVGLGQWWCKRQQQLNAHSAGDAP